RLLGVVMKKELQSLSIADLKEHPVWRFTDNPEVEQEIETVHAHSLRDLEGVLVGAKVKFADGSRKWALLENVNRAGKKVNDHFLTITVENQDKWFRLARYHDDEIDDQGPSALAKFLGKKVTEVFPIRYDLRIPLMSDSGRMIGKIEKSPEQPLDSDELKVLATKH
ncbi:MAG: hypothetical protein WEE51_11765, partial [Pirellulaceae bacterium]